MKGRKILLSFRYSFCPYFASYFLGDIQVLQADSRSYWRDHHSGQAAGNARQAGHSHLLSQEVILMEDFPRKKQHTII
jgi:hypothetical protein